MTSILYKELYEQAYKLGRKHRHVTAILYKNICVIGKNELMSGRCGHHHDFSVHSEISCLNQFLKQVIKTNDSRKVHINVNNAWIHHKLPRITVINVRVNQNGYVAESKPCEGCLSVLKNYNIKEFQYFDGEKIVIKKFQ
jgi:hypothetical protein